MENKIKGVKKEIVSKLNLVKDLKDIEKLRVEYLGRKGIVTLLLRKLGSFSAEERPKAGQLLNQTKREIEELLKIKEINYDISMIAILLYPGWFATTAAYTAFTVLQQSAYTQWKERQEKENEQANSSR